jgi:dTDP-glucose 4,6-dehydratase
MDTWLVTGGAGFIGSNFVRAALASTPHRVVVLDKLTYAGHLESLAGLERDARFGFVRGDVADRATVEAAYAAHRPTVVVHFAAETHVDRSIDGPREFVRTNVGGTQEMLEGARLHLLSLPGPDRARFRFLHVSTDEVYGSLDATGRFTEETAYAPRSPYAASKAGADHLVHAWHETYGVPTIVTNCSNNYGPYQYPEKLVPLMVLNALEGKPLPVYGDGKNVRDWLHVEDHARGILLAIERGRSGGRYNFGGDAERTNLEVVEAVCDALEREAPPGHGDALRAKGIARYRDLVTFVTDRPGHDRRYAIDAARARADLGWAPRHDFAGGIAATVRWYLEHRAWCDAVQGGASARRRQGLGTPGATR